MVAWTRLLARPVRNDDRSTSDDGAAQVAPSNAAVPAREAPAPFTALGAPPARVHVTYALGADCPPPAAFEAELDARLGPTWKAAPDELARDLVIDETDAGHIHVVRMEYEDEEWRTITRTVSAPTCDEALALIAVITAVAIEAQPREAPPKTAAARETSPPPRRPAPPARPIRVSPALNTTLAFAHGVRFH